MNGRQARARRTAELARLQHTLNAMKDATPRLVASLAGQDQYLVGPVLVSIPALRDDYPADIKTAIDRRRRATLTGRCDCGAQRTITPRGGLHIAHTPACPAGDHNLHHLAAAHGLAIQHTA